MPRLQAVFWDVDGTLADTEMDGHRPAFNQAFADLGWGWQWNRDEYQRLLAIPGGTQRVAQYAIERGELLDATKLEDLRRCKQLHYLNRIRGGAVSLRPGVSRLLNQLVHAGLQQWIVTSSGRASVEALLEGLFANADVPFDGVVSANDVERHKPNPDPYLCALERSGADLDGSLAIEDSAAGLIAAHEASLTCLVTPSLWDQQLPKQLHRACAVFNHLGEATLPHLQTSGPPCAKGMVTLEYLQSLVDSTC